MNIIRKLAGRLTGKSLSAPTDFERRLLGIRATAAGISVTPRNAMNCVPVRCAVQVIAEAIGQLPVQTYHRNEDGDKERSDEHPAHNLLRRSVNNFIPASEFREMVTRDALLWGNGYAVILRDGDNKPAELNRLQPDKVRIIIDETTQEPSYEYEFEGTKAVYNLEDIIHIRAPTFDGITGESPIEAAKEAIAFALALEKHGSVLFRNSAQPGGVIEHPGKMGDDAANRMADSWQKANGGDNAGGVAVLEEGSTFKQIGMSNTDAQFLELRRYCVEEIGRAFRVPPIFLNDYGRATWSNNEQQGSQLVTYCLMSWIKRWEGEIMLKLFSEEERDEWFAEFLTDDLLRADTAKRMAAYAVAITSRIMNPNECRARENLPAYEGGDEYVNPNTTSDKAVADLLDDKKPQDTVSVDERN